MATCTEHGEWERRFLACPKCFNDGDPSRPADKPGKAPKVCVFDNPATFSREAWQDGKLLCAVQATVLEGRDFNGGSWFPFMLNVGPWRIGTYYGDREAVAVPECGTRSNPIDAIYKELGEVVPGSSLEAALYHADEAWHGLERELAAKERDRQQHEQAAHEADLRTQAAVRAEKAAIARSATQPSKGLLADLEFIARELEDPAQDLKGCARRVREAAAALSRSTSGLTYIQGIDDAQHICASAYITAAENGEHLSDHDKAVNSGVLRCMNALRAAVQSASGKQK